MKELLYEVEYRKGDEPVKTLPMYSPSSEIATARAREFGERVRVNIIRITQVPFHRLHSGVELPGEIRV